MDLKISQLSEYPGAQGFYTLGSQDGHTVKYNLGTFEDKVGSLVSAVGPKTFSETKQYQLGDFVEYNGEAYKFIQSHLGAWNSNHATKTTAFEEIMLLTEVEDKQATLFVVTSDDTSLNLGGKTISVEVEGENTPRTGLTDSEGKVTIMIPRDKTFVASLGVISGYSSSSSLTSRSLSTEATMNFRYYKEIQTTEKTLTINITVTGSGILSDFNNLESGIFLSDEKTFGTSTFTSGVATFTWQDSGLSGTVIYPGAPSGYTVTGDSRNVEFTSSDTTVTLNYNKA